MRHSAHAQRATWVRKTSTWVQSELLYKSTWVRRISTWVRCQPLSISTWVRRTSTWVRARSLTITLFFAAFWSPAPSWAQTDPTLPTPVASAGPSPAPPLHPVPVDQLRPAAPSPQWDLGLLAGICLHAPPHAPESLHFCGKVLGDLSWLRRLPSHGGLGLSGSLGTRGFADFRLGVGGLVFFPLHPLVVVQAGAGPYLHTDAYGVSPGAEAHLSFGWRVLNQSGHYGHHHGVVLGVEHTPGESSRAGTTVSVSLRLDAFWLSALGLLF